MVRDLESLEFDLRPGSARQFIEEIQKTQKGRKNPMKGVSCLKPPLAQILFFVELNTCH